MKPTGHRLFFFLMLCLAPMLGVSQVHFSDSLQNDLEVKDISFFIDHNRAFTKADVGDQLFSDSLSDFDRLINLHNPERIFWVKFRIEKTGNIADDFGFVLPNCSRVTVYQTYPSGRQTESHVGLEDIGNNYLEDRDQRVVTLDFRSEAFMDVLVKFQHRSRLVGRKFFYIEMAKVESFDSYKISRRPSKGGAGYLFLLFCGIMIFQGLYVLLQWYLVRKREYFYYGLYVISVFFYYYLRFSAFYAENEDWALLNSTDLTNFNDVFLIIPSIFYLFFTSSFVDLKERDRKLYEWFAFFQVFLTVCVIIQALLLFIPNDANKMMPILVALAAQFPFAVFALVRIYRQRRAVARFLVAGSSIAFLSHLLANVLPIISKDFMKVVSPLEMTMIGIIIEVIIFNAGLLFKAKETELERVKAQGDYIQELKSREALQVEYANVRDKIASDLHDDVGSSLSSIGIYSYAAKENLQAGKTEQTSALLENIKRSAESTLNAMSDLVWATNPRNDSNDKLVERIRSFAYEILSAKDCLFKLDVDEAFYQIRLNQADRKNILLILKEGINNAAKYAKASHVDLKISVGRDSYTVQLSDNGMGIAKESAQGNGMRTMRKRAGDLGADFSLDSNPEGTVIKLTK